MPERFDKDIESKPVSENNDYPVDEFLDKIEEQGFETKAVTMSFENVVKMKRWAMKDWANSWRGELPTEIKDSSGNLVAVSYTHLTLPPNREV